MAAERLLEVCERAGLDVLNAPLRKWNVEFRRRWRAEFAPPGADWRRVRYEWDLLGTEQAPALEGRAAIRTFDARRHEARRAFLMCSPDYREILEVEGALPNHAWWRSALPTEDLYIVQSDWDWSLVLSHEETAMSIGPFFVERFQP